MKMIYKILPVVVLLLIGFSCDNSEMSDSEIDLVTEDFSIIAPLVVMDADTIGFLRGSSSEGEVSYKLLSQTPENSVVLGVRFGEIIADDPSILNSGAVDQVQLVVEVKKGGATKVSNVSINRNPNDPDGDGVATLEDDAPEDPCSPIQNETYTGYNKYNSIWLNADCDGDGLSNGEELDLDRNPYLNESLIGDIDGDGIRDDQDDDPEDPCTPEHFAGYTDYNADNDIWAMADCDGDGVPNIDELAAGDDPYPESNECNLNFDLSNFEGELRTVDSSNGEGVTIGFVSESCGEIIFSGDFLNLGCFNEDIEMILFLEPESETSSNGNAIVDSFTFSCLSEDGTESTEYTFEGFGNYVGSTSTIELIYTLKFDDETLPGTLIIRPL